MNCEVVTLLQATWLEQWSALQPHPLHQPHQPHDGLLNMGYSFLVLVVLFIILLYKGEESSGYGIALYTLGIWHSHPQGHFGRIILPAPTCECPFLTSDLTAIDPQAGMLADRPFPMDACTSPCALNPCLYSNNCLPSLSQAVYCPFFLLHVVCVTTNQDGERR